MPKMYRKMFLKILKKGSRHTTDMFSSQHKTDTVRLPINGQSTHQSIGDDRLLLTTYGIDFTSRPITCMEMTLDDDTLHVGELIEWSGFGKFKQAY